MKRALILIGLAAATAACQRASASTDQPAAAPPGSGSPVAARLMTRGPETRDRIQPGRIKCAEPVASIPC